MTTAERRFILEQYKQGQASIEQVERLLDASPERIPAVQSVPQNVHVQIAEDGEKKTSLKIPFSMVKAGLKLGKSFGILGSRYNLKSPTAQLAIEALQDINLDELLSAIKKGEIALPYHIIDILDTEESKPETQISVVLQ